MIIGGLDVGTTGCKIALFDENCNLLKTYYTEYDVKHQNGQHEIDFADVKKGVIGLLKEAVADYRIDGLGVTSFGETFAMLDENDNILAPSMLYTDPRGEDEVAFLSDKIGNEKYAEITGVTPQAMYSISKIMWIKNNLVNAYKNAKRILLGEDYIVYSLTGVAQIDYSLAARTAAFDIKNLCWSKEIFDVAGVDMSLMSTPVETGTVAGKVTNEIKKLLGINYDIVVVNGAHDQVAGIIGSGVFEVGQAMDGTGTVECIPAVLDAPPQNLDFYQKGYSVVPYLNGKYACYALSFTGGATLKWFRDNFAEAEKAYARENNLNEYALLDGRVKPTPTDILVLPHFAGAATPYMDTTAKASFVGITLETDKVDIYKALMEGTSYEIRLNFDILKEFTENIHTVKATGGGANSDIWLQIKADIIGSDIIALSCKEVGAAGTAALCGKAMGVYGSLNETVLKMAPIRKIFSPNLENHKAYQLNYKKYSNLYNAIKGL